MTDLRHNYKYAKRCYEEATISGTYEEIESEFKKCIKASKALNDQVTVV